MLVLVVFMSALGAESQTLYVKRNNAYVREGPGSYYPFIVVLQYGARIRQLSSSGDWYKVAAPEDRVGWIAANCLSNQVSQAAMFNRISQGWSSARASESALSAAIKGFAKKYGKVDTGDVNSLLEYSHKNFTASELAAFDRPVADHQSRNRGRLSIEDLGFKNHGYDPSFDEQAIGVGIAARLISRGIVREPALTRYVNMIAAALAENSQVYDWDFTVFVLNDSIIDGFACPGGYIFITLGALKACDDESMLAAIIAHEMGHVIREHGLQEMTKRLVDIKADSAFAELDEETQETSKVDEEMEALAENSYDIVVHKRLLRYETEADEISAVLCANAGYDPSGVVRLDGKVAVLSAATPDIFGEDFSMQNDPAERYALIKDFVQKRFSKTDPGAELRQRFELETAGITK